MRGPAAERFAKQYIPEPNSGCWLWTGAVDRKGYGRLWLAERNTWAAHKFSYELFKGPLPPGLIVRHTCDTPCCVNPDHLLVGTSQDNVDDAVKRGRHAYGAGHGAAKLTEAQARAILADPRHPDLVAAEYGISSRSVRYLRMGRNWKHLHYEPLSEEHKRKIAKLRASRDHANT